MPIRSRILLKTIAALSIVLIVFGLTGCLGTTNSRGGGGDFLGTPFIGVAADIEFITADKGRDIFNLYPILMPLFTISLPLDLVFDVILLPADVSVVFVEYLRDRAKEKRVALYRQKYYEKFRRMCFKGINLTNSYRIHFRAVTTNYAVLIGTYDGSDINIEGCWGEDIPKQWQEDLTIGVEWEEGRTDKQIYNYWKEGSEQWIEYKEKHGEDDLRYQQLLKLPYYNEQTKAIAIVFLPCHQSMAVAVSEDVVTSKLLDNPILSKRYKELSEQAQNNRCPVLAYPASTEARYPKNSFDKEKKEIEATWYRE